MAYGKNTYKGKYKPKNPEKYKGDPNEIVYRSSWERAFMVKCDNNPNVISWTSETVIIPYQSPRDGLQHRYFVDFAMKVRDSQGNINTYLVEIKPYAFTQPPKVPKKQNNRFITEMLDYAVNQAKWEAARKVCDQNGAKFLVLTERELDPSAK